MNHILTKLFTLLVMVSVVACSADEHKPALSYQINVDNENSLFARIVVDTSAMPNFVLEESRTLPSVDNEKKLAVLCEDSEGIKKILPFNQPATCQAIQWETEFEPLVGHHYDASSQKNIYSSQGWWLFFEWGNLPRFQGVSMAQVCVDSQNTTICQTLPSKDAAPLFLVWGENTTTLSEGKLNLHLFIDTTLLADKISQLQKPMSELYIYLENIFSKETPPSNLSLIWVAIDEDYGMIGGAASNNAFISNYLVANGTLTDTSLVDLLRVSAHETVHLLSQYTFPTWINESLAEYYAYKSLTRVGLETRTPKLEWQQMSTFFEKADTGLYLAHNKVIEENDMSYYPLFYLKGSAFWQELDEALEAVGDSLDNHIVLLDSEDIQSATINPIFKDEMMKIIGVEQWQALYKRYL